MCTPLTLLGVASILTPHLAAFSIFGTYTSLESVGPKIHRPPDAVPAYQEPVSSRGGDQGYG